MRTRNGLCYPKREDAAHVSCRHRRRKRPREEDAATAGKRRRRAAGVDMFEALPDDLVVAVLCKLGAGAASPADLQNAHAKGHINELPDDVLNRIFSFLNLQGAAKARVLSRRWRRLPTFISNLCLDPLTMFGIPIVRDSCRPVNNERKDKFIRAANQILHVYEVLSPEIDCFTVRFRLGDESACHIDRWISWALRMRARKIDLTPSYILKDSGLYKFAFSSSFQSMEYNMERCQAQVFI